MLIALTLSAAGMAQPLFSIDGKDVTAGEFRRECRDYVEEADTFGLYSLMMDYADYRLAIHEAKQKSCDTTQQFRNAMQYYSNLLMLEHVAKNARSQALITKIYQHSAYQYKVWVARVDIYANSGRDTTAAYNKAQKFIDKINSGRKFEDVARQMSDAPQSKYDGGYLGWVSPIDFHVGAEALDFIFNHYNNPQLSRPIRSGDYYYIIKVDGRRNAISEVVISPIIIRKQNRWKINDSLKQLIEKIDADLKSGKDFADLQKQYSDIKYPERHTLASAYRKYSTQIADIPGVGKFSGIIETSNYYCIARLDSETPLNADNHYHRALNSKLLGTDYFSECYDSYLDSIRKASNYHKTSKLDKIYKLMPDSSIFEGKWQPEYNAGLDAELLSFAGESHSLREFAEYIRTTQYNTGYTKIPDYVAQRFEEYLDMLTQKAAAKSISHSNYYKEEMDYYSNIVYYEMLNPCKNFATNTLDSAKVYKFYKDSKLSYKTSHVLNIRFYDYRSEQNRKKATKIAQELAANPRYEYNASILKSTDAGTFKKGDNTLADKIISDFDNGMHGKVFFFPEQHVMAIAEIEKNPEELPWEDIYPIVSSQYLDSQKENYFKQLREKYHLEISPDASKILETLF